MKNKTLFNSKVRFLLTGLFFLVALAFTFTACEKLPIPDDIINPDDGRGGGDDGRGGNGDGTGGGTGGDDGRGGTGDGTGGGTGGDDGRGGTGDGTGGR